MQKNRQHSILFIFLAIAFLLLFAVNISVGAVSIPLGDVAASLTGNGASKSTWEYIIINYRLPKAITAIIAGIGLSVSGLLMQTLFRNPLAGPDVLGLSSGASLGVAFIILGAAMLPVGVAGVFLSPYGIVLASVCGSVVVLLAVLLMAQKLRDTMAILIVGLMFTSFTGAVVSVLTYFSSAEQLQKFTYWSLGSLGSLPAENIVILAVTSFIGLLCGAVCLKPLDALLLGERYAQSLGINFKRTRFIIIIATSLLAGSITAFAGPIAFIGLAVPHIARLLFRTGSHYVLFWATMLLGGIVLLGCDTISQLPGKFTLPINAVTSIIGAPVVIWLLLRKNRMMA